MSKKSLKALKERLKARVRIDEKLGCWIWLGAKNAQGYGQIWDKGKNKKVSRVAYELYRGPIRKGLEMDHYLFPDRCLGPSCCNPQHLLPTTRSANASRTAWARKTHCPQGHEYSVENTVIEDTGRGGKGRRCRICRTAKAVRWAKRNPEKVRSYRRKRQQRLQLAKAEQALETQKLKAA